MVSTASGNHPPPDAAAFERELLARERTLRALIERALAERAPPRAVRPAPRLTPHEAAAVRLLAEGLTNRQIGARLGLARGSVRNILGRAYRKLGATGRAQAAVR